MGDAIYALPAIKQLSNMTGEQVHFYTSRYCEPLKNLFEYQPYIDKFYVSESYELTGMDMGCQPWRVPLDLSLYKKTFHLGFRKVPDCAIPEFIAREVGLSGAGDISYITPNKKWLSDEYIVLAPRGVTTFEDTFNRFIDKCKITVAIVGAKGDFIGGIKEHVIDFTGLDFLDTADLISSSRGFVGLMSSQLVLANGYNIPKVIPHDGKSWDMNHVIYSESHHYLVNPSAGDIVSGLGL
jgi:hypothetical protein